MNSAPSSNPAIQDLHFDGFAQANSKVRDLIDNHEYRTAAILSKQCTIILTRGYDDVVKVTWGETC